LQTIYIKNENCTIIAGIHNSAKVWVTYTKYTILDSNEIGGILHLRYESDITTFL